MQNSAEENMTFVYFSCQNKLLSRGMEELLLFCLWREGGIHKVKELCKEKQRECSDGGEKDIIDHREKKIIKSDTDKSFLFSP